MTDGGANSARTSRTEVRTRLDTDEQVVHLNQAVRGPDDRLWITTGLSGDAVALSYPVEDADWEVRRIPRAEFDADYRALRASDGTPRWGW